MVLNMPIQFPSGMLACRRFAQVTSGALLNVDGEFVPYNPYIGVCNMDHLQEVVANPFLRGLVMNPGGIATVRRVYV